MPGQRVNFDIAASLATWFDSEGRWLITDATARATPNWHGGLSMRWAATRHTSLGSMRIEVRNDSTAPKWDWLEEGTRPHMPPVAAITPWAKDHDIDPWALAMIIKKEGTKAQPFIDRAMRDTEPLITPGIEAAVEAALSGETP